MLQYGYQSQKEVVNLHADSLSEVLHGFNFLLQDLLLRSCFSPCAFQQLEQHFDNFAQLYGRQKIRTHSKTAFCKVVTQFNDQIFYCADS